MEGLPAVVIKVELDVNSVESVQAGVAEIVEQSGTIGQSLLSWVAASQLLTGLSGSRQIFASTTPDKAALAR